MHLMYCIDAYGYITRYYQSMFLRFFSYAVPILCSFTRLSVGSITNVNVDTIRRVLIFSLDSRLVVEGKEKLGVP